MKQSMMFAVHLIPTSHNSLPLPFLPSSLFRLSVRNPGTGQASVTAPRPGSYNVNPTAEGGPRPRL